MYMFSSNRRQKRPSCAQALLDSLAVLLSWFWSRLMTGALPADQHCYYNAKDCHSCCAHLRSRAAGSPRKHGDDPLQARPEHIKLRALRFRHNDFLARDPLVQHHKHLPQSRPIILN